MATQLQKTVDETTDQVISLISQAQEATSSVVRSVSDAVAPYVPGLGLGEALITPEETVDASFQVSNKFVDAGRAFAISMVQAVSPVTDKLLGKKVAPKATKSA